MSLKLMYITNDCEIATILEEYGVNRIWIDLEWRGKEERQRGLNTVKSNHIPEDITKMRPVLKKAELMVRINPMGDYTREEIDDVISRGADLVMLPMFHNEQEVLDFVNMVDGRAKTMLLLETKEAAKHIEKIVKIPGIDEIHIGLNDLHLEYGMSFMFELLANGTVERLCNVIKKEGIPYGFGGIAKLDEGTLPAKYIIAEHYRLGSSMAILSRSFCNIWVNKDLEQVRNDFSIGMRDLRLYEHELMTKDAIFFEQNKSLVQDRVKEIVSKKL